MISIFFFLEMHKVRMVHKMSGLHIRTTLTIPSREDLQGQLSALTGLKLLSMVTSGPLSPVLVRSARLTMSLKVPIRANILTSPFFKKALWSLFKLKWLKWKIQILGKVFTNRMILMKRKYFGRIWADWWYWIDFNGGQLMRRVIFNYAKDILFLYFCIHGHIMWSINSIFIY